MASSELQYQIQNWIQLDNQLKKLNEQIKIVREQKNFLENNITNCAKNNNMTQTVFRFGNDKIRLIDTKTPEPLTFKYLEKSLGEIIKNETQVKHIIEYIKQKRTMKTVSELKRFSNN